MNYFGPFGQIVGLPMNTLAIGFALFQRDYRGKNLKNQGTIF
jgi:hypothetical protein